MTPLPYRPRPNSRSLRRSPLKPRQLAGPNHRAARGIAVATSLMQFSAMFRVPRPLAEADAGRLRVAGTLPHL